MPCWPDIWNRLVYDRWLIVPFLFIAVIVLMLWAPKVKWLWIRVILRIVGGVASVFVVFLVGFAALLTSSAPKSQYRTVISPNGVHKAILMYQAGFLGRDVSVVSITTRNHCQHFWVYQYEGPSDLSSTSMKWIDDSHLAVRYYYDPNRYQRCRTHVADVTVTCAPRPGPYGAK